MLKEFNKEDKELCGGSIQFQHLEKSAVLQEAHLFNEIPINPLKCAHILTKILYLRDPQLLGHGLVPFQAC